MIDLWKTLILGVVEGFTEFLPVSSTGHLIVVGEWMSFSGEKAASFEIFIQLGAILAVLILYRGRFLSLLDFSAQGSFSGVSGCKRIIVGCLPVLLVGFVAHDFIKSHLFNSTSVAVALIVGGLAMLWTERRDRSVRCTSLESLTVGQAFKIGLFQCLSLWSGISRSGSTIVGGMLVGVERKTAAEFSFLLAVPIMFAATAYDLLKSYKFLSIEDLGTFGLGFLVSFLAAMVAVKGFISLLGKFSLLGFAYYRIALGLLVLFIVNLKSPCQ